MSKKNEKKSKLNNLRDPRLAGLRVLFKEILQQIPVDQAELLRKGYLDGKGIVLVIRESSYGQDCMTAFQFALSAHIKLVQGNLSEIPVGPMN